MTRKKAKKSKKKARTPAKGDTSNRIQQSEERLKNVLDVSTEWYWEQDENFRFTQIIGAGFGATGIVPKSYVGTLRWDHGAVPVGDGGSWDRHKAVLKARQPFVNFLYWRINPQGAARYICASGQPVFGERKRFQGYRGIARDDTDRVQMELRLGIEHGVTRVLADSNSIAEATPQIISVICQTLGWSCGARWVPDEQGEAIRCAETWGVASAGIDSFLESTRRQAPSTQLGGLNRRAWVQGEPLWIRDVTTEATFRRAPEALNAGLRSAFAFPIKVGAQSIGVMEFFSSDIHQPDAELLNGTRYIGSQIGQFMQRKQTEEALRESEERFRAVVDSANEGILVYDRSLRVISGNAVAGRIIGLPLADIIGAAGFTSLLPCVREDGSPFRPEDRPTSKTVRDGKPLANQIIGIKRPDGFVTWLSVSTGFLRRRGESEYYGVVSILSDITVAKRAEQLLRLEHMVARCLAENESASKALKIVLQGVCETQDWACGRYFGRDDMAGELKLTEFWHTPSAAIERFIAQSRGVTYAPGVGLIGAVWQSEQPMWVPDIAKDSRIRKGVAREAGMHGAFFFPVVSAGKCIGVFAFHSRQIREPDDRLLQTVLVIGGQIGQFLQRKQAEEALRKSNERFNLAVGVTNDIIWDWDLVDDQQWRNENFSTVFGYTPAEAHSGIEFWRNCIRSEDRDRVQAGIQSVLDSTSSNWSDEYQFRRRDGSYAQVLDRAQIIRNPSGRAVRMIGAMADITERKQAEERIQYLATHDGLTSLPNRVMFAQVLNLTIQNALRYKRNFAVLFIDLDRFKNINDTLGHEAGDQLLREIAERLITCLRASDVVARLGGDEFVVLVQETGETEQVIAVSRKILAAVMRPISISGQECWVTASIGICMYPADAQDEQTLMKNADIAMYLAKEEGKNNFQFYSESIKVQSLERLTLETSLRHALDHNEFLLHYQAKLELKTNRITGVEALLRWQHPDLGVVSPARFIPMAEETGLIVPIGKWVLRTACAQNVAWQRQGLPPVCMAVNLSARQFADENLVNDLVAVFEETGMNPELLELELTESMVMQNPERTTKLLTAIKQMGVRIAIDDFGVGYSSLAQIKRFPIDTLKVDRSFIRDLAANAEDRAITEAIISMGRTLSLTVVAEGVETQEQQNFLIDHSCDAMQGFYFSKPIDQDDFATLLKKHLASTKND
jgi:diguanylate cyclase (GGDEF)-like protein/PAS domain S-box-containing protein